MPTGEYGRRAGMYSTTWAAFPETDWNYHAGGVWCGNDFYFIEERSFSRGSYWGGMTPSGWGAYEENWMPLLWRMTPQGSEMVIGGLTGVTDYSLWGYPGGVPDGYGPHTALSTDVENMPSLCSDGTYIYYTNQTDHSIRRFNPETLMLDTIVGQHTSATANPSAIVDSGGTTVLLYSPAYDFLSYVNVTGGGPTEVPFGATIEPGGANEEDVTVTSITDYGSYVRWNLQSVLTYDHPVSSTVQFDGVGTPAVMFPYGPTYHDGWVYFWDGATGDGSALRRVSTSSPHTLQTLIDYRDHSRYPFDYDDWAWFGTTNSVTGLPHYLDSDFTGADLGGLFYHEGYLYFTQNHQPNYLEVSDSWSHQPSALRRIAIGGSYEIETLYWQDYENPLYEEPFPGYPGDYQSSTNPAYGMALSMEPEIIWHGFLMFQDVHPQVVIYDDYAYVQLWFIGFHSESFAASFNWTLVRLKLSDLEAGAPVKHDPHYPLYEYVVNEYPWSLDVRTKWFGKKIFTQEGYNPYYYYGPMINAVSVGPDGLYAVHPVVWVSYEYPNGCWLVSKLTDSATSTDAQGRFTLSFEGSTAQGLVSGQRTKVMGPVQLS